MRVRELRMARGWSQAQLAELSGLSIRTIQRIENGTHPGLESLSRLAAVFEVSVADLHSRSVERSGRGPFMEAVTQGIRQYDDFTGRAGRAEFWWFSVAVGLAVALGAAIGPWLGTVVGVVVFLPWLAFATRRLRDAGESPWWLLIVFAPVGGIVVLAVLFAMPSAAEAPDRAAPDPQPDAG